MTSCVHVKFNDVIFEYTKKSTKILLFRFQKLYNLKNEMKRLPYICCMICNEALSYGLNMAVQSEMGDN